MPMSTIKKDKEILIEFPRVVYPSIQTDWDGEDYTQLESIRVENAQEYKELNIDTVLNYKDVKNKAARKPAKKQKKKGV